MRRRGGGPCVEFTKGVMLLDLSSDTGYQPPLDVTEGDDSVRILLEMPGVPADKVCVLVRGDCIEVTGEKLPDFPKGEISFLCLERGFGKFCRAFEIMGPVNLGMISARYKDGILTVTIPKMTERRGRERRIPVIQD